MEKTKRGYLCFMKIYIASKYIEHSEINNKIHQTLMNNGFDSFLPKAINIDGTTMSEMTKISEICYDSIDTTDVMIVVTPYGRSVSAEIGYFINEKRKNKNKTLILYTYSNINYDIESCEAMIVPYFDYIIEAFNLGTERSLKQLIKFLQSI